KPHKLGRLIAHWHKLGYLCIRLPSGRDLFYYDARLVPSTKFDGALEIHYQDGSKRDDQSAYVKTYGGKLVENCVQAIARDLLVHSMHVIDAAGLDLILHVHDEAVVEVDADDTNSRDLVDEAMRTLPDWADGLPLEAET